MRLDDVRIATRNSTIFMGIAPSGRRIAIKRVVSRERAELEHRSLAELFETTQGAVHVARPICLIAEHGLVVLEWAPGRSVYDYLRDHRVPVNEAHRVMAASGLWLRKFHAIDMGDQGEIQLTRKLKQLDQLYEDVPRGRFAKCCLGWMRSRLRSSAHEFAGRLLRQGRLHGDFKPENLLIEGDRVTAIDFGPIYRSHLWNDVAYFLVQIEWTVLRCRNLKLLFRTASLRRAFLAAYQTEFDTETAGVLAWLEREVLYRLAHHYLSAARIRPRHLIALVVIVWMFVSRGAAARKLGEGSPGDSGNAP